MAKTKVKLTPEVTDVLNRSTFGTNSVQLPEQLDRKSYEAVNKVIVLAGGKWNRSAKAHIFQEDPREALGLALETGEIVDQKKLRQAYYTPEVIADEVAMLSNVVGCRVLEPSAGGGALVDALLKFGASRVDCIEMEPKCLEILQQKTPHDVIIADFLQVEPQPIYDRVVMNPPFTGNQDTKHILQALKWLNPNGRLFAIIPLSEHPKLNMKVVKEFENGSFKESGTMVATRLVEVFANES
jgi:predicted RNA methylase